MNHLAIAMIVGEQHVRREVDHIQWVDEGTIQAEEVFQRGAKVMLAELLKTHAIVPRKVSERFPHEPILTQGSWDAMLQQIEVK